MRRLIGIVITAAIFSIAMCACGEVREAPSPSTAPTLEVVASAAPEPTTGPEPDAEPAVSETDGAWADAYLAFLEDNSDIFSALWPEGLSGVGFADLDIDGTPEMIVFDPGASATMGVQFFDLVDGQVWCVSSVMDSAEGAFGGEHFSKISVCASYFESFRLIRSEDGLSFWVDSANGTLESAWNELIRFDCEDGYLTPVSVCARYEQSDVETGEVLAESYTVAGEPSDAAGYEAAAALLTDGEDLCYDASGVFLWNDMDRYDTTTEGLLSMARDAVDAYEPLPAF